MKYVVAITEIVEYLVPVTARSEADAERLAMNKIVMTRNRDQWCVAVRARECEGINLDEPPAVSSGVRAKR